MSAAPARPPYEAYAALIATYSGGLMAARLPARLIGRDPQANTGLELVELAAANFKAARTISRDKVTSFVRDPFVEGDAYDGEDEKPAGTGLKRAVGELVTCTRCIGTWTAAGPASAQIGAPGFGRMLRWSPAASAANAFRRAGFTALTQKSNELEERVGG